MGKRCCYFSGYRCAILTLGQMRTGPAVIAVEVLPSKTETRQHLARVPTRPACTIRDHPAGSSWIEKSREAKAAGKAVCPEEIKRLAIARTKVFWPVIVG